MSYPPPGPNNPYAQSPPPGAPPPGYAQQGPPPGPPGGYPGGAYNYGYPQAPHPGGLWMPERMPGTVITARVLLFVAGALWGLCALFILIVGAALNDVAGELPMADGGGDVALGGALIMFVIFGGLAALHIVPASMFGRGTQGTRVTAIIAASVNALMPCLGFFALASEDNLGNPITLLLWAATAILTIVFCSLAQAGQWFNRPRYR
ncbi:hypothetical protein [Streptomyces oceani]|uniref:Uncharacterized protein n=1 Tax=Streptomyces oceani TaxID=1075402 RepID=A0A1E7KI47_9ACTN|nr:hypothetical protein [Streptomyces oceani]OEV03565.1 hypothetical protein AN216_10900 [Streptomyces oceani]